MNGRGFCEQNARKQLLAGGGQPVALTLPIGPWHNGMPAPPKTEVGIGTA